MAETWFYTCEGKQMDPVTMKELKRLVGDGVLKPTDMVWKEGMPRWVRASSLTELFPEPTSSLDQFFTSSASQEASKPGGKMEAKQVAAVAPAQGKSGSAEPVAKKSSPAAEPDDKPRPRTKKRQPADDDRDADERPRRRREEPASGGSSLGIILALVAGAGILLIALVVGVIILILVAAPGPPRIPGGGPDKRNANAAPPPIDENTLIKAPTTYNVQLNPDEKKSRSFSFRKGAKYEITVNPQPRFPNVDVDLYIFVPNGREEIRDDRPNPECRLEWTPHQDGQYEVQLHNFVVNSRGGVAVNCTVTIREVTPPPQAPPKNDPPEPPLPPGVLSGTGNVKPNLMLPGQEHVFKLQVKGGQRMEIRVVTLDFKAGSNLNVFVLKDSDEGQIAAQTRPSAIMRVNFMVPATEIVRVRVLNASKTSANRCTIYYSTLP